VDYGLWLLAIDPGIFGPKEEFRRGVDAVVQAVKSARPEAGVTEVLIPGERAWRDRERRLQEGVDLPDPLFQHLTRLAADARESAG
jgi:LDH2 family malate/lactate/ureidoglycolate dehydrogenase